MFFLGVSKWNNDCFIMRQALENTLATLKSVEIFAVGTWNGMKFVAGDLTDIADNTNALIQRSRHNPPLKLGHSEEQILDQEDGQPALGWLENFSVHEDKLVADMVSVPGILIEAMSADLFRNISVEMRNIEEFGWIVTAAAILGADLPAVKSLEDLQAFLPDGARADLTEVIASLNFSAVAPTFEALKEKEPDMSEIDELKAKLAEMENTNKAQTLTLAERDAAVKSLEADKTVALFSAAKTDALAPFEQYVKDGKMKPALRDEIAAEFDGQKADFKSDSSLGVSAVLLSKISSGEGMTFGETAKDDDHEDETSSDEPDLVFSAKVDEIMVDKDCDYTKAFSMASRKYPALLKAYVDNPYHTRADTRPVAKG